MSVIGPRPGLWNQDLLTAERDKYGANDVKPGLTGWAQINGRDELEIPEKVSKFLNKRTIGELAIKHGLNFLESTAVKKGEIPENLEYPVITKAIDSTVGGWKNDMYSVLLPAMSNEQNDRIKVREMTRKSIKISTYIMAPLMIG